MSEIFNSKIFNGEVFQKYVDRIPNTKLNELIKSRAVTQRQDLVGAMKDQVGGNYITTPLKGLISGAVPLNYDGITDITADQTKTFSHSRVVVGRAKAWTERDFSYDITAGVDFMENIAAQISSYWDEIDQETLVHILNGVFNMNDTAGAEFVDKHTHDITSLVNSEGTTGFMDATTLNTAMQKACGDHKGKFSLAIMHSAVATHLENLKLLTYLKYNDANGMQRDTGMATLNGRLVLIDDSMPVAMVGTKQGQYTVTVGGSPATGEKYTVGPYTFTVASTQTTNAVVEGIVALAANDPNYSITKSSTTVIAIEEKTGHWGAGIPAVAGGTLTAATVQDPDAKNHYTTYMFGDGAIEYTNCGAKVPYEMDRDPARFGGQDTLYSRQRKCFSPYGISFTQDTMASLSPTNAELEIGANWELVNSRENTNKIYIAHKAIAIGRIISLG